MNEHSEEQGLRVHHLVNLGGLIAPVLTPFLSHLVMAQFDVSEEAGWQWGIALGGLICLLGATLWWWVDPNER